MDDISTSALFSILCFLILLSAFFSGSETALMTINRYRLRHLADSGHTGAIKTISLLEKPDRLIGLILLGNNFVNILASSIATIIALRLGGEAAIAIATGVLTLVILLFAEVAPKTLAAVQPERLAFPAAYIYRPLMIVLFPLVWLINLVSNAWLKLIGVDVKSGDVSSLSAEELRTIVKETGAMIPRRHQNMLLSVLDLENATVEDIMVPRQEIDGIDLESSKSELEQQLLNAPYTRMLLFDGNIDNILGIVHMKRAMKTLMKGELTKERLKALVVAPYFIPEGTRLSQQLLNFQRKKRRLALIVNEYGDLTGLVTLEDLLEEIVGEFTTDSTTFGQNITQQDDGSFLIEGTANLKDLVKATQWKLPVDGPKTLNGLILEYMETIPETGTSLRLAGYPVEILQVQNNAVKMVRIFPDLYQPDR